MLLCWLYIYHDCAYFEKKRTHEGDTEGTELRLRDLDMYYRARGSMESKDYSKTELCRFIYSSNSQRIIIKIWPLEDETCGCP